MVLPQVTFADSVTVTTAPGTPFSFDTVKDLARDLAKQPYKAPVLEDGHVLDQIDYDNHNQVQFNADRSLWLDDDKRSPVQFFFPGRYFRQPVQISRVEGGMAREVPFSLDLFSIPKGNPANNLTHTKGFAGLRVLDAKSKRDWMAFLGGSYWRTEGYSGQFGLSTRGLAVDTAIPDGPEEFPNFTHFWLEPGADGDLTVYALMDSPRVTGAYQIKSHRDQGVRQEVSAMIFLREDIERLGISPLTSMYWFSKHDHFIAPDWRPEVHDSDGLEMLMANGERIWRPLNNPPRVMANTFSATGLKGFGLMQRERDFRQYQDDGVFYERRASAWVEPIGDWGEGTVTLVELTTTDETNDNIVAMWQPAKPAKKGEEFEFAYRLSWLEDKPQPATSARFKAIRIGAGGIPGQDRLPGVVKVVADFDSRGLAGLGGKDSVTLNIGASKGKISSPAVFPIVGQTDWRAIFDLDFNELGADDDTPIDIRGYVEHGGEAVTETLLLQLFPSQLRELLAAHP